MFSERGVSFSERVVIIAWGGWGVIHSKSESGVCSLREGCVWSQRAGCDNEGGVCDTLEV